MTYSSEMTAGQQKSLPELFRFITVSENAYYTDYERELVFNSNTYSPATIKRSAFSFDNKLGVVKCSIASAVNDKFLEYIAYYPVDRTRVTIFRATEDDLTEYATIFDGYIQTVGFEDNTVTIMVEEKSTILSAELDMFVFQARCNHHIFDSNCGLDYINWKVDAYLQSVDGVTLISSDLLGYEEDYFTGGEVHYQGDARLITSYDNATGTITLHVPFDSRVSALMTVEVFPSCGGDPDKCIDTFDNYDNFLGCPYIPTKNPAVWGV